MPPSLAKQFKKRGCGGLAPTSPRSGQGVSSCTILKTRAYALSASRRGGGKHPHPLFLIASREMGASPHTPIVPKKNLARFKKRLTKKGLCKIPRIFFEILAIEFFGTAPKLAKRGVYLLLVMGTAGSALLGISR